MKKTIDNWLDLAALPNTAVIRDKHGDVFEKRGGHWCGHEVANLSNDLMAKFLPVTVLDNGHFPGRLAAATEALKQTCVADSPADPEDIARFALEAADAWEREEFGGPPTITLYHDRDDSEESLHSYIHDALLELTNDGGVDTQLMDTRAAVITATVVDFMGSCRLWRYSAHSS